MQKIGEDLSAPPKTPHQDLQRGSPKIPSLFDSQRVVREYSELARMMGGVMAHQRPNIIGLHSPVQGVENPPGEPLNPIEPLKEPPPFSIEVDDLVRLSFETRQGPQVSRSFRRRLDDHAPEKKRTDESCHDADGRGHPLPP